MALTTPHTDPEHPRPQDGEGAPDAPLTFVPHDPSGAVGHAPVKIQTGRYGELEAHELVHLLDSLEDERSRGRFRESIYISAFFYLALAWFIFYGPRVLWHAPKVKLPSDVLKERELTVLNAPILPRPKLQPIPRNEVPPPKPPPVDNFRMDRSTANQPKISTNTTAGEAPKPNPAMPTHAPDLPAAPAPQPSARPASPPPVADAPTPQPGARIPRSESASDMMHDLSRGISRGGESRPAMVPAPGGGTVGSGAEILSDTMGTNFSPYLMSLKRLIEPTWMTLLPEEVRPPLSKKGETFIILTILPDGTIGDMKLEASTHDEAINKSAWASITAQGKLPPLPRSFQGPNLVLRLRYMVNMDRP